MPYKCSCGLVTDNGNAYSAHFKHYKGEGHKRLGWIDPETGEVFPTRPRLTKTSGYTAPMGQQKITTEGIVPVAGIGGPRPPVIFELEQEKIPLNWRSLYEAYQYYRDLKEEEELTGGFAETMLGCVKYVWKMSRVQTEIKDNKILAEVTHGGRNRGPDEKEGGAAGEGERA